MTLVRNNIVIKNCAGSINMDEIKHSDEDDFEFPFNKERKYRITLL